jgi:hypothetical protein
MWQGFKQGLSDFFAEMWDRFKDFLADVSGATWKKVLAVFAVLLILYYPIGMALYHKVDDNTSYRTFTSGAEAGGSASVAVIANLITREIDTHTWVMNDPFFKPSVLLDNMPNFQQGMFSAFSRFAIELRDHIGRTRGSSAADTDLETAAGLLPYPGDVWIFNFSTSLFPTASAEQQYIKARQSLLAYNARLVKGEAIFERRADNLLDTMERIAKDIGSSTAALDDHIANNAGGWLDFTSDNLFYNVKGQSYGYYMILSALADDYAQIISDRELKSSFTQMLESFRVVAELDPILVSNNEIDDLILPNHLAAQGFYLSRARTQLKEITNILLK